MADSVSEAVGDAAKTAVLALGLTSGGNPVPVVKRKTPSLPPGKDPPQIVISVGEEGESKALTAAHKQKVYPVAVTIVTAGGEKAGDDPQVRQWREQVETKLEARATWEGVDGFVFARPTNKAPFDPEALPKNLNVATVVANVTVIEARA